MSNEHDTKDEDGRRRRHKLLWVLLALFLFVSITGMMLADQYYQAKTGAGTAAQDLGG